MTLELKHRGEIQAGAINFEGPSTFSVFEIIKLMKITKDMNIDRQRQRQRERRVSKLRWGALYH